MNLSCDTATAGAAPKGRERAGFPDLKCLRYDREMSHRDTNWCTWTEFARERSPEPRSARPDGEGKTGAERVATAGRRGSGSVTVGGAGVVEQMDVPGAGPVTVPVGANAQPGTRPLMAGGVVPVARSAIRVVRVAMRAMPVPVTVEAAGVTVGARVNAVGVQVEPVGVPVMSVRMPRVVRPGIRRGVGMGHREEGDERAEGEPRDGITAASASVPAMVPPPRLGGAGKDEQSGKSEYRKPHHASLPTEPTSRAPANVAKLHHPPPRSAASHSEPPRTGVKSAARLLRASASGPATVAAVAEGRRATAREARQKRAFPADANVYTIVCDDD